MSYIYGAVTIEYRGYGDKLKYKCKSDHGADEASLKNIAKVLNQNPSYAGITKIKVVENPGRYVREYVSTDGVRFTMKKNAKK